MTKNFFTGGRQPDDIDNAIMGAHAVGGLGYFIGGCIHIPAVMAITKSDLQGFWKFLAITAIGANGLDCFRRGGAEFAKITQMFDDSKTEETDTDGEEDAEKPAEEESEESKVVEISDLKKED